MKIRSVKHIRDIAIGDEILFWKTKQFYTVYKIEDVEYVGSPYKRFYFDEFFEEYSISDKIETYYIIDLKSFKLVLITHDMFSDQSPCPVHVLVSNDFPRNSNIWTISYVPSTHPLNVKLYCTDKVSHKPVEGYNDWTLNESKYNIGKYHRGK